MGSTRLGSQGQVFSLVRWFSALFQPLDAFQQLRLTESVHDRPDRPMEARVMAQKPPGQRQGGIRSAQGG
eukprot:5678830-Pyramimonas_sp.AAC.1